MPSMTSTTTTATVAAGDVTSAAPVLTGARVLAPDDGALVRVEASVHPLRVALATTADLTAGTVTLAVTDLADRPASSDWLTAVLEAGQSTAGEWIVRATVGPLDAGQWAVWARLTSTSWVQVVLVGAVDVE